MSCGKPHETPCSEVLDRVYWYLDGEVSDDDCSHIRQHLDECGPCLREYGLEEVVKKLVAKHCACDPAPADLRGKVLVRIRQVQAEIEVADLSPGGWTPVPQICFPGAPLPAVRGYRPVLPYSPLMCVHA